MPKCSDFLCVLICNPTFEISLPHMKSGPLCSGQTYRYTSKQAAILGAHHQVFLPRGADRAITPKTFLPSKTRRNKIMQGEASGKKLSDCCLLDKSVSFVTLHKVLPTKKIMRNLLQKSPLLTPPPLQKDYGLSLNVLSSFTLERSSVIIIYALQVTFCLALRCQSY